MRFTVYKQPHCDTCIKIIRELFATGAVVEILEDDDLAAMPDIDRRNNLMAQIHERVRTDFPFIFRNDELVEWDVLKGELEMSA